MCTWCLEMTVLIHRSESAGFQKYNFYVFATYINLLASDIRLLQYKHFSTHRGFSLTINGQTWQFCPIKGTPFSSRRSNAVLQWAFNLNSALADSRNLAFKRLFPRGQIVFMGHRAYIWSPTHLVVYYHVIQLLQVKTVVMYMGTFCCLLQDLKLNMLLAESLPLLAQLLHQLACDLQLQEYVLHYWKDFPFHCPLVTCSLVRHVACWPCIAFNILVFPAHVSSSVLYHNYCSNW